ncbi:MAG TPA: hypothetical protein VFB13_17765 [Reyranella sp.]|nr:hypothetical protein [Reyranella sp.]
MSTTAKPKRPYRVSDEVGRPPDPPFVRARVEIETSIALVLARIAREAVSVAPDVTARRVVAAVFGLPSILALAQSNDPNARQARALLAWLFGRFPRLGGTIPDAERLTADHYSLQRFDRYYARYCLVLDQLGLLKGD